MIKGVIFDVDGTLLDSMEIWEDVGVRYLNSIGIEAEPDLGTVLFTMSIQEGAAYVKEHYHLSQEPEEIEQGVLDIISNYVTLDETGILLTKAILNRNLRARLLQAMYQAGYDMVHDNMNCLFPLDCIAQMHQPERERRWHPGLCMGHFFSCQMDVVRKINNRNTNVIEVPDEFLYQALRDASVNTTQARLG